MGSVNNNSRRKRQRGSSMVETALVFMVAVTVMLGIMDMGQVLFLRSSVGERMRAALRYGAIQYDETKIRNVVLYGTDTPAEGASPSFGLTAQMVGVARLDANSPADRIQITISNYPIKFFAPFIAGQIAGPTLYAVGSVEAPAEN
jgi:Flp pilus assembly protein TadG